MKFTKMQGCGNDYIYINLFEEKKCDFSELSRKISERHFGIGSDGIITIGPSNIADFKMQIFNADGSEAEMCGNGIRCVGKYVFDNGLTNKEKISIETLAGIKELKLNVDSGLVKTVEVDMGIPCLNSNKIPVLFNKEKVINERIILNGENINITCVSMGNPHTIIFVDDVDTVEIEKYGKMLEENSLFPNKTNVEFVKVISKNEIAMRVWERGSNETWACGTGACASVMASILNKRTSNEVLVHLRGGDLKIKYEKNKHIIMEGEAKKVFVGEVELL